jgi:hypothetical protein
MTDYAEYRLPQIWEMLREENEWSNLEHVTAWTRQMAVLSDHSAALSVLKQNLAAQWPPTSSTAAETFLSYLEEIHTLVNTAADDSASIRTGVNIVTTALEDARRQVEALHDQYYDEAAALKSLNQTLQRGRGVIPPSNARSIAMTNHQRKLDEQARGIMIETDKAVNDAHRSIGAPLPPYRPINAVKPVGPAPPTGPGTASGPGNRRASASTPGNGAYEPIAHNVPPPQFSPPTPDLSTGPILATDPRASGGTPPPQASSPPSIFNQAAGSHTGLVIGGPTAPVGVRGLSDPPAARSRREPGQHAAGRGVRLGTGNTPANGQVIGGRVSPPEGREFGTGVPGVIGAARGDTSASSARRSYGGSTGYEASQTTHAGRIVEGGRNPGGLASGGWRDSQYEEYANRRRRPRAGDPDDQWIVREGVSPVLEPSPEKPHDVGPGVIGLDR